MGVHDRRFRAQNRRGTVHQFPSGRCARPSMAACRCRSAVSPRGTRVNRTSVLMLAAESSIGRHATAFRRPGAVADARRARPGRGVPLPVFRMPGPGESDPRASMCGPIFPPAAHGSDLCPTSIVRRLNALRCVEDLPSALRAVSFASPGGRDWSRVPDPGTEFRSGGLHSRSATPQLEEWTRMHSGIDECIPKRLGFRRS